MRLLRVIAAIVSGLLILEFSLSAISMLSVMGVAVERFSTLTRTSPGTGVVVLIGLLDLIAVIAMIVGFRRPWAAVTAGAFLALLSGFVLLRQIDGGDRGSDLLSYSLFLGAAVVLVITRLAEGVRTRSVAAAR
ncbi:hypothetical protein [Streptomyces sp. NPDC051569]|uniref:hypothetical protein n=1 Tax=Streptomyces sp. NPDC051569 TaxID=3365661 RepID=UPI00379181A5